MDDEVAYYVNNFKELQEWLGPRPGDYRIDPFYLRAGIAGQDKPYFWDDPAKKWRLVRYGDMFCKRTDGSIFMVPQALTGRAS